MRRLRLVALALLLGGCAAPLDNRPVPGLADDYPEPLLRHMARHGCEPVRDIAALRRAGAWPAFAYDYLVERRDEDSAVMWCQRERPGVRRYLLLVQTEHAAVRARLSCPDVIETDEPVGRLSVGTIGFLRSMKGFVSLKDPRRTITEDSSLDRHHIVSTRPGQATAYVCHAGEWWVYRFR